MVRVALKKGAKLKRVEKNLSDPRVALRVIGEMLVSESRKSFRAQRYGTKRWPARAPINVFGILSDFAKGGKPPKRRFQDRPALIDTSTLSRSIAYRIVGKSSVEAGTTVSYARVHMRGGPVKSVPITEKVQSALAEWLKGPKRKPKSKTKKVGQKRRKARFSQKRARSAQAIDGPSSTPPKAKKKVVRKGRRKKKRKKIKLSKEIKAQLKRRLLQQQGGDGKKKKAKRTSTSGSAYRAKLGWLLNPKLRGTQLTQRVQARPFLGLTPILVRDIRRAVGVNVVEAR